MSKYPPLRKAAPEELRANLPKNLDGKIRRWDTDKGGFGGGREWHEVLVDGKEAC